MNRKEKIFPDAYDDPVRMQAQQFERAPFRPRAIGGWDGGAIARNFLHGTSKIEIVQQDAAELNRFFPQKTSKNRKKNYHSNHSMSQHLKFPGTPEFGFETPTLKATSV